MLIDLYAGADAEGKGHHFDVLPTHAHLLTGRVIILYDGLATFDDNPAGGSLSESWAKADKCIKPSSDRQRGLGEK